MDVVLKQSHEMSSCHDMSLVAQHQTSPAAGESLNSSASSTSNAGTASLKSRSPFFNTLREDVMSRSSDPVTARIQSMPQHLSSSGHYSTAGNQAQLLHAQQHVNLLNRSDSELSSRGVVSLQPNSAASSSNTSMTSSGVPSYDSMTLDPLVAGASPQPAMRHKPPHSIAGDPGVNRVNANHPGYVVESQIPTSHTAPITGPRLEGQGHHYPQPSQYQQRQQPDSISPAYSGSGGNWRPNDRVVPAEVHYTTQPTSYGVLGNTTQGGHQAQYYSNYHRAGGQGAATEGVAGYYHTQQPLSQQPLTHTHPQPQYNQYGHTSTYHPHSTHYSFGSSASSYSGSNYDYDYEGYTHCNVPYTPLSGSKSGVPPSAQSYNGPHNGYAPSSIPYHPLSNASSLSSAELSWQEYNQTSGYPAPIGLVSSPPQGQSVAIGQQAIKQPNSHLGAQYTPTNAAPNGFQSHQVPGGPHSMYPHNQQQQYSQQQPNLPRIQYNSASISSKAKSSEPPQLPCQHRPVTNAGPNAGELSKSQYSSGGASAEDLLVPPLEKMELKPHAHDELPKSGQSGDRQHQTPIAELHTPQPSTLSSDDDNQSTYTSFLSESLNREEDLDENAPLVKVPSVEILEQPRDCEIARNGRIELLCKAQLINSELEEQPTYLWYKDDEPLVGEIGSELIVEGVGEGEEGRYHCLVSHPNGLSCKETRAAVVTIKSGNDARAPVLVSQPEAYVEVVRGEPLVLSIETTGEAPMSYIWFKGAQKLKYCSGSVLRVPGASALDSGQYCCTVSNVYGSVLSDVVLVKVVLQRTVPPPFSHSSGRKRCSSNPEDAVPTDLTLRQFARPVAQQTKNWARLALYLGLMPGEAANSQHYQASKEEKAYHLLREWRDRKQATLYALKTILSQAGVSLDELSSQSSNHSISSSSSAFSQPSSLSISSQPCDTVVIYGQEARLEVRTEKIDQSTKFQWYKNGHRLVGKTEKQLIIASTVDSDAGSYTCQISSPEGTVMSHPATIKVVSVAPQGQQFHQQPQPTDIRTNVARKQYHSGGLTGRGVDDDNYDDDRSLPVRTAIPSGPQQVPGKGLDILQIVEHPQPQIVAPGSKVTLRCHASVNGHSKEEVTYVWYMNGLSLPEDTTADYHISSMSEEDEGMYSCEVSYKSQSLMSDMATVSLEK